VSGDIGFVGEGVRVGRGDQNEETYTVCVAYN